MKNNIEERIIGLREQNKGYQTIANILGLKRDQVRYVCIKYDLTGVRAEQTNQYGNPKQMEKRFKEQFERLNPRFKYHSGYTGANENFNSQCRICGYIQERSAQAGRPSKKGIEIICNLCEETYKQRRELISTLARILNAKQKETNRIIRGEIDSIRRIANNHSYYLECEECGRNFFSRFERVTCSSRCGNKRSNRMGFIKRRQRIVNNGDVHWDISIDRIVKRDGSKCCMCGEEVDFKDYTTRIDGTFIAGNRYPSIDHVIPISKGGTHTWDNVKLAHRRCNSMKKDNTGIIIDDDGQVMISI